VVAYQVVLEVVVVVSEKVGHLCPRSKWPNWPAEMQIKETMVSSTIYSAIYVHVHARFTSFMGWRFS
jgi:hypothetical protein